MINNPIIPEEEWAIMSNQEKMSILFPDVSTKPLTDEEIDISEEIMWDDQQNG